MSSFFNLELDTTSPILAIYSPIYTTKVANAEITIQSNEILAQIQEIYIIDSANQRVNFTFSYQTDKYVGTIDFSSLEIGMANIYATLKDTVLNETSVSKSIAIIDSSNVILELSEFIQIINKNETTHDLRLSEITNGLIKNVLTQEIVKSEFPYLLETDQILQVLDKEQKITVLERSEEEII